MVHTLPFADTTVPVPGYRAMGINSAMGHSLSLEEAEPVLLQAIELGCTFWDTAGVYAMGMNEKLFGDFIRKHNVRDKLFVIPHFLLAGQGLHGDWRSATRRRWTRYASLIVVSVRPVRSRHDWSRVSYQRAKQRGRRASFEVKKKWTSGLHLVRLHQTNGPESKPSQFVSPDEDWQRPIGVHPRLWWRQRIWQGSLNTPALADVHLSL